MAKARLDPEEIKRRRKAIEDAQAAGGTRADAARALGISENSLATFMDRHAWDFKGLWPQGRGARFRSAAGNHPLRRMTDDDAPPDDWR